MNTIIFANGIIKDPEKLKSLLPPVELIIAADGGGKYCLQMGIMPQVVIGDLDSLTTEELTTFIQAGATILRFPKRKDETDLELAIQYAIEKEVSDLWLVGALGGRWDMTFANLLMVTNKELCSCKITFLEEHQKLYPIFKETTIQGNPGDTVSLIPLHGDAQGVTTQGLEYPLDNGTLHYGSPRGVSNILLEKQATVTLIEGLLLCVVIDQDFK